MKNQLITLFIFALLAVVACKQPTATEATEAAEGTEAPEAKAASAQPDYADFDKKVGIIQTFFQAHSAENIDLMREMLADSVKYSPPAYNGNKWVGKEDYLSALKGYHDNFDDIKFEEGITLADTLVGGMWSGSVYPQATASNTPDAIRVYGTWTAKHTETGKDIGVKWFGLCWINEAGKIAQFTDYFDVHGLAAQVAD